ncbi:hypothetical protein PIB30_041556 [Stylosanthes scabra]|uniref:Uncharacterized protein n=1 Tax=Stylosanthes scabra TaxID=79078 RepID=A0ABU6ZDQ6_9FABA|nr:hypothetical protein [Stylosanthes scabra]
MGFQHGRRRDAASSRTSSTGAKCGAFRRQGNRQQRSGKGKGAAMVDFSTMGVWEKRLRKLVENGEKSTGNELLKGKNAAFRLTDYRGIFWTKNSPQNRWKTPHKIRRKIPPLIRTVNPPVTSVFLVVFLGKPSTWFFLGKSKADRSSKYSRIQYAYKRSENYEVWTKSQRSIIFLYNTSLKAPTTLRSKSENRSFVCSLRVVSVSVMTFFVCSANSLWYLVSILTLPSRLSTPSLSPLYYGLPKLFDLGKSLSSYMTLKLAMVDSNSSFALTFAFTASDFSISTAAFRACNALKSAIGCAQRHSQ